MRLPGGVRKESSELGETPSPKHFLGADKAAQVPEAEETHCEPASSVQKEAESGYYAEHFPPFPGIPGALKSYLPVAPHSSATDGVQGHQ